MSHYIIYTTKDEDEKLLMKTIRSLMNFGSVLLKRVSTYDEISLQEESEDCVVYLYPGESLLEEFNGDEDVLFEEGTSLGHCYSRITHTSFGLERFEIRGTRSCKIEMSVRSPKYEDVCILAQGDVSKIKTELLEKYPDVYEIYFRLGALYLSQSNHALCIQNLEKAKELKDSKNNGLVYSKLWRGIELEVNYSIAAFYVNEHQEGKMSLDRILFSKNTRYHNNAYTNYEYYLQPLDVLWNKTYKVSDLLEKDEGLKSSLSGWHSLNPSLFPVVIEGKQCYFVNLRVVNWKVNPIGFNQYTSPHPKNKFKTKNLLGILDHKGEWICEPSLIQKHETLDLGKIRKHHIDGFEDCRLIYHDLSRNKLHFITNYSKNHPEGEARLSLGVIDIEGENIEGEKLKCKYVSLKPIYGHGEKSTQKNWLVSDVEPIQAHSKENTISIQKAIYFYQPFEWVSISSFKGDYVAKVIQTTTSDDKVSSLNFGAWRGSAGPIPFDEGYLLIVHQVYFKDHGGRRYLHRFIYLDENRSIRKCSNLWYVSSKDIEYVSTLVYSKTSNQYLMGYGLCDSCACVCGLDPTSIRNQLVDIASFKI